VILHTSSKLTSMHMLLQWQCLAYMLVPGVLSWYFWPAGSQPAGGPHMRHAGPRAGTWLEVMILHAAIVHGTRILCNWCLSCVAAVLPWSACMSPVEAGRRAACSDCVVL
jgi:hypothetical protein